MSTTSVAEPLPGVSATHAIGSAQATSAPRTAADTKVATIAAKPQTVATTRGTVGKGSSALEGTTWKGGNLIDANIVFTFDRGAACSITSMMYSGPCTYSEDGNQVSIKLKGTTYVFSRDASRMAGSYIGANIQLAKQS